MNYGNQLPLFTSVYTCLQKPVFIPFRGPELHSINSEMYPVHFENLQRPVKSRPFLTADEFHGPSNGLCLFLSILNFAKVLTSDEFHRGETGQSMDSSCFSTSNFMQIDGICRAETPALRFCDE